MKNLLVVVVVLLIAVCALGFWRGWFEVGGRKDEGKAQASLKVDLNKLKEDKDHFKRALSDRAKSMKEKLASLKDKAKNATGQAKAEVENEIASLSKKHESIESKMKEVEAGCFKQLIFVRPAWPARSARCSFTTRRYGTMWRILRPVALGAVLCSAA